MLCILKYPLDLKDSRNYSVWRNLNHSCASALEKLPTWANFTSLSIHGSVKQQSDNRLLIIMNFYLNKETHRALSFTVTQLSSR